MTPDETAIGACGYYAAAVELRSENERLRAIVDQARIREPVAWCKYTTWGDGRVTIRTCDEDADNAFPVYR